MRSYSAANSLATGSTPAEAMVVEHSWSELAVKAERPMKMSSRLEVFQHFQKPECVWKQEI